MSAPKYCDDPDHCAYSDCPTAFCDRDASTHLLKKPCSTVVLSERLRVWLHNFRNRGTAQAYKKLCNSMQTDKSYAHSWHCNIAMPIYDGAKGKLTTRQANDIADNIMRHMFSVSAREPK